MDEEIVKPHAPTGREVFLKLLFGSIANTAEWYDFALFGLLAPQIGQAFFPGKEPSLELMKSFGIFAAAFVMRPAGGAIFGALGDSVGRKWALYLSILLMGFSTSCIGLLPSYETGGYTGPVLLAVLRMLQCASVGGQMPGTILLTTEGVPSENTSLYLSAIMVSGTISGILATAVIAMVHTCLSSEAVYAWGWRLPFFTGVVSMLAAFMVDSSVKESSEFQAAAAKEVLERESSEPPRTPGLVQTLRAYPGAIALTTVLVSALSFTQYCLYVWVPSYLTRQRQPPVAGIYKLMTIAQALAALAMPLIGWSADRVGTKHFLPGGFVLVAFATMPVFLAMESGNRVFWALAHFMQVIASSCVWVTLGTWMPRLVPTKARYTVTAMGYNTAQCFFGGNAPLISTALTRHFGTALAVGYFQLALVALVFPFSLYMWYIWDDVVLATPISTDGLLEDSALSYRTGAESEAPSSTGSSSSSDSSE